MPAIQKIKGIQITLIAVDTNDTMAAYHCSCPNVPGCNTGSAVIGCKMRQITVIGAVNVTVGGPGSQRLDYDCRKDCDGDCQNLKDCAIMIALWLPE